MAVTDDGTLVVAGEEAEALLPSGDRVLTPADLERVTRNIADRLSWLASKTAQSLRQEAYGFLLEADQTPGEDDVKPVARQLVELYENLDAIGERFKRGARAFLDEAGQEAITVKTKVKGQDGITFRVPGALYTVMAAGQEITTWAIEPLAQVLSGVFATGYAVERDVADRKPLAQRHREALEAYDKARNIQAGSKTPEAENDAVEAATKALKLVENEVNTAEHAAYQKGAYEAIKGLVDYANIGWKVTPLNALAAQLEERGRYDLAGMIRTARTDLFKPRADPGFALKRDTRKK